MLGATAAPSGASVAPPSQEELATYVAARAADASGDPARAAELFAGLARERPEDMSVRRRAIAGAIVAGDMAMALELGRPLAISGTPLDLRLLLVADELRRGREARALEMLRTREGIIDSGFLAPFVEAWALADRRDPAALRSLDKVARGSALAPALDEHRALLLLRLRRPGEAAPLAERALADAGGRGDRLRLAFADGFRAAGDKTRALAMLDGADPAMAEARARITAGKSIGQAIDTPAKAYGELLLGLSIALNRLENKALPISLAQVARYANPENSAGTLLLGLLLESDGRTEDGLRVLRSIPSDDPFASRALDAEVRLLVDAGKSEEAFRRAHDIAATRPSADALARLGVVFVELERFGEAADAYGRAIALSASGPSSDEPWTLHLFRASALEQAGKWPEAKAELDVALKLSPDNPLLLNFLGYGKLERGEDLDAAEALVRKASALRPDDASITDSLGWAQFKRGRLPEAVATLERAAQADPAQAEIQEHLGDALYTSGRRIEARFAWRAALVTAEPEAKKRIETKIETGLTPATAAP